MFNQNLTIVVIFLAVLLILAILVRKFAPFIVGKELKSNSTSNEMRIIASLAIEPGIRLHKVDAEDRTLLLIVNSNRNSSVSSIDYNAKTSGLNNDTMKAVPNA
ncbi:hypothetical protein OAC47_00995 [Planktomarina temperata]|nr:hypothetical protein [Planktomarina temperata]